MRAHHGEEDRGKRYVLQQLINQPRALSRLRVEDRSHRDGRSQHPRRPRQQAVASTRNEALAGSSCLTRPRMSPNLKEGTQEHRRKIDSDGNPSRGCPLTPRGSTFAREQEQLGR